MIVFTLRLNSNPHTLQAAAECEVQHIDEDIKSEEEDREEQDSDEDTAGGDEDQDGAEEEEEEGG